MLEQLRGKGKTKIVRIKTSSILSIASSVLLLSAYVGAAKTTANSLTTNVVVTPSVQPEENEKIRGELQRGKTQSVILYVGRETGDYAGYCFANNSEVGRSILAACKNRQQCEVTGKIDHVGGCNVPGLEADLSDSGKIVKVVSARRVGRKNAKRVVRKSNRT